MCVTRQRAKYGCTPSPLPTRTPTPLPTSYHFILETRKALGAKAHTVMNSAMTSMHILVQDCIGCCLATKSPTWCWWKWAFPDNKDIEEHFHKTLKTEMKILPGFEFYVVTCSYPFLCTLVQLIKVHALEE